MFNRDMEREQMEQALLESERNYNIMINGFTDVFALYEVVDGKFRYVKVNNSFLKTYKLTEEQLIGKFIQDAVPAELAETWIKNDLEAVRLGSEVCKEVDTHKYGIWETRYIPIKNDRGRCTHLIVTAHNITEQKKIETEMARLDRLDLIGKMAAGIGHEVRNPMTVVKGFLQLLMAKDRYIDDREFFQIMIAEIDKGNSIITEFLSLAKDKRVKYERYNLNDVIKNIVPLLRADALVTDKKVDLSTGDIPDFLMDQKEISQLIVNLVRNGLEAMEPYKCLTIKTYLDGEDIVLAVCDQGPGIPVEVLDKMGTPFYTTKDLGTGLGLAICYSIAARHNAMIDAETGPAGTNIYVRFGQ